MERDQAWAIGEVGYAATPSPLAALAKAGNHSTTAVVFPQTGTFEPLKPRLMIKPSSQDLHARAGTANGMKHPRHRCPHHVGTQLFRGQHHAHQHHDGQSPLHDRFSLQQSIQTQSSPSATARRFMTRAEDAPSHPGSVPPHRRHKSAARHGPNALVRHCRSAVDITLWTTDLAAGMTLLLRPPTTT